MSTSTRTALESALTADWAGIAALSKVRVVATERNLDPPSRPTALIRQKTVARLPEAPQANRSVGMLLTLIASHEDYDKAADQLDTIVYAALDYLGPRYIHEPATAVQYDDRLAYDIHMTVITDKD